MDRNSSLSSGSQQMPTVHGKAGGGGGGGDLTRASLQTGGAARKRIARPCQSPSTYRHTPRIHHTNKHLKQSPHYQIESILSSFMQSTLSVSLFYCLMRENNKSVIYRHIKPKFCGFRPGETIVWSMTCWLPAQPIDQYNVAVSICGSIWCDRERKLLRAAF